MTDDAFARMHACSPARLLACSPRTTSIAAIKFPMKNRRVQCVDSNSGH
ncbi:hypothetical protein G3O06_33610 [Burkholderia sp. Ac-20345]|nr:hypothetical protein [Burkholderia sp. Ac-20345]MBN3782438.1 hypothetical protein [Burkholderia sp. Ac-20345]